MNLLKKFAKEHILFLLILWILPSLVYFKTLPHSLYFIDAGVTVTAAYTLGIPTPPGYPSYTMLAHLFTKLAFGDPLFRLQIFSILTSLLTLTLVYFFIQKLIQHLRGENQAPANSHLGGERITKLISLLAALSLAFSYTFWSQTLNAQSYIFTDLLLLTIIYLLTFASVKNIFKIGLIAAILGAIAAGGSTVMVITVLPIIIYLFFRFWNNLGIYKLTILAILAIFLLAAIYSYLPIRARSYPFLNWGNPQTPQLFLNHVQGLGLSFNDPVSGKITGLVFSPISFAKVIIRYFYLLLNQFAYIPILFVPLGAFYLFKNNKRWFYVLLSIAGMNLLLGGLWLSGNQEAWFILSNIVFTIFIGIGMYNALRTINRRSLALLGMTLLSFLPLLFWFSRINRTNEFYLKDYANNLYANLPKNTILFGIYDTFNAATLDRHELRGDRKDVFPIMTNELYVVQNYRDHLRHLRPDLVPKEIDEMATFSSEKEYNDMLNFYIIYLLKKGYPVYVSHPVYSKNVFVGAQGGVFNPDPKKLKTIPAGLSMKMELSDVILNEASPKAGAVKDLSGRNDIQASDQDFNFKFQNPKEYKTPAYFLEKGYVSGYEDLATEYGVAYIVYANYLLEQQPQNQFSGGLGGLGASFARYRMEPGFARTDPGAQNGVYKNALTYFQKAEAIAPNSQEVLTRLAIAYAGQGEYKKSQSLFKQLADKDPNNTNLQFNLAKSYADSGDTDKAKDMFNQIISNSKEEDQVNPAAKDQLKLLEQLAKHPQNYQPFENSDMNIKFYYPEGFAITFGSQNMIKLTNNAKGKDELTMLIFAKTLKDDEGIDDLGQLPFVIDGVMLQTQPGQFPGFASKLKLYSSGPDTILLLELKKDRLVLAVRIFPGDSNKQQEFLNILQSIRVLR